MWYRTENDVKQVQTGNLEPGGQLVLTLKGAEQGYQGRHR